MSSESHQIVPARFAVLGSPIAHSKSPAIHRAAYAVLGLDWTYDAFELQAAELEPFLSARDDSWRGFSLTMPLKERAFELARERDAAAEQSGVVNTLLAGKNGWRGFNTDIPGLARALTESEFDLAHTVILGAGATAVSAILAARLGGADRITVLARRPEAAKELARRFECDHGALQTDTPAEAVSAVISTLPGPAGETIDLPTLIEAAPLFDVAYHPWPSPLAQRWSQRGVRVESGLTMLIQQALLQIRIFTHGTPQQALPNEEGVLAAMRHAGMKE